MRPVQRNLDLVVAQYERLMEAVLRDAQLAVNRAESLASFFSLVGRSGMVDSEVILGKEVFQLTYPPKKNGRDSGICYQAIIRIPDGIGVLEMDTESHYELMQYPEGLESNTCFSFVSLVACRPVIQQWLLPQIDSLIEKLLAILPLKPRPIQPLITRINVQVNHRPAH
ncbi:MAG: hypothetical protein QM703_13550 [Gemmatales bacterium]